MKKPFEQEKDKQEKTSRRTAKRRHLIYYLRVWDLDKEEVLGHVVDITTEGIMLISDAPIEQGKKYNMEIRWNDPEGEFMKIDFQAESRWSKQDVNTSFFDTGFKFVGGTEGTFIPIQDMIDRFGFDD